MSRVYGSLSQLESTIRPEDRRANGKKEPEQPMIRYHGYGVPIPGTNELVYCYARGFAEAQKRVYQELIERLTQQITLQAAVSR